MTHLLVKTATNMPTVILSILAMKSTLIAMMMAPSSVILEFRIAHGLKRSKINPIVLITLTLTNSVT